MLECLIMRADSVKQEELKDTQRVAALSGWDTLYCFFHFIWFRPPNEHEKEPDRKVSVEGKGPRSQLPELLEAVGVSMVGLGFRDERESHYSAAFVNKYDDLKTIRFLEAPAAVAEWIQNCDCVPLEGVVR